MNFRSLESIIRDVMTKKTEKQDYTCLEHSVRKVMKEQFNLPKSVLAQQHKAPIEIDPNDQIAVGAYKTKHFEMSPEAQKFFVSLPRDADLDKAEKMVVLHDKLFGMLKQLKVQNGASNDEKRQAKDIVDRINHIADRIGTMGKHEYLNDIMREINNFDPVKDAKKTLPKEPTGEITMDKDIDNSKLPISRAAKMQRKIKIIDED